MKIEQSLFASMGAIFVPIFHYLYGEGEVKYIPLTIIILLVIMDWISGTSTSEKDGSYASEYGIQGIKRTAFLLLLPSIGHLMDQSLNLPGIIFGMFAFGIIYHLLKSCLANTVRAGWGKWIPEQIIQWVIDEIEHKAARALKRKKKKKS